MNVHIQVKLYANLNPFTPVNADSYALDKGSTIAQLLDQLNIPKDKVRLIFINNLKGDLNSILKGGERVGIFPPIGGG